MDSRREQKRVLKNLVSFVYTVRKTVLKRQIKLSRKGIWMCCFDSWQHLVFAELNRFRPRILIDVSKIDMTTTILGFKISMPIMIAPTAMQKMAHPEGEYATARAASAAGTIMVCIFKLTRCIVWVDPNLPMNKCFTQMGHNCHLLP